MHFSIFSRTSSSTIAEDEKYSPPWTTLWPTALTSLISFITPVFSSVKADITALIASLWVGMSTSLVIFSHLSLWYVIELLSIPILSHKPLAKTCSFSESINWNLSDELPQFITNTSICSSHTNCFKYNYIFWYPKN